MFISTLGSADGNVSIGRQLEYLSVLCRFYNFMFHWFPRSQKFPRCQSFHILLPSFLNHYNRLHDRFHRHKSSILYIWLLVCPDTSKYIQFLLQRSSFLLVRERKCQRNPSIEFFSFFFIFWFLVKYSANCNCLFVLS